MYEIALKTPYYVTFLNTLPKSIPMHLAGLQKEIGTGISYWNSEGFQELISRKIDESKVSTALKNWQTRWTLIPSTICSEVF